MSATPSEVRIEHSVADQAALGRAFTTFYAVLALVGIAVALVLRPELLLGAAAFAVMVVGWRWQLRRAQAGAQPWLVQLTPSVLRHAHAGGEVVVAKGDAATVRIDDRPGPRMRLHVLEVRGHDGRDLLTVSLPGRDEATMLEAAFEEWGWPVGPAGSG